MRKSHRLFFFSFEYLVLNPTARWLCATEKFHTKHEFVIPEMTVHYFCNGIKNLQETEIFRRVISRHRRNLAVVEFSCHIDSTFFTSIVSCHQQHHSENFVEKKSTRMQRTALSFPKQFTTYPPTEKWSAINRIHFSFEKIEGFHQKKKATIEETRARPRSDFHLASLFIKIKHGYGMRPIGW